MRKYTFLYMVAALLLLPVSLLAQSEQQNADDHIVVEDFEQGIGDWFTNDDEVAGTGPSKKCAIYADTNPAADGGNQCGRLEYDATNSGWASITLPVQGRNWADRDCSKLSMWLRGNGTKVPIRLVLRVQTINPKRDIAYSQVLTVKSTEWQKYHLRALGFKNVEGKTLSESDIQHIRLLQFAKNGGWPDFNLWVDGINLRKDPGAPQIPEPQADTPTKTVSIEPQFSPTEPSWRLRIGANLGKAPTVIDAEKAGLRSWAYALLADIAPASARVELSGYLNYDDRSYDLDLLHKHLKWVRKCDCRPILCLDVPRPGNQNIEEKKKLFETYLDTVSNIASQIADKDTADDTAVYYELFDEPLSSAVFQDMGHVIAAYNNITEIIKQADPEATIGGPGLASAWDDHIRTFLQQADQLDFLSLHFYGTNNLKTDNARLFKAAYKTRTASLPHQLSFRQIRQLIPELRDDAPDVYITEGAMSSVRDDKNSCRDDRMSTAFSAAWLGATLLTAAPHIDAFLYHQLKPGNWGMIGDSGYPQTPYWAAWLIQRCAPAGAIRPEILRIDDSTIAATVKTDTANNLIIATVHSDPIEIRINPSGMSEITAVRQRSISDADQQWKRKNLTPDPRQTIITRGAGVIVIEYLKAKQ